LNKLKSSIEQNLHGVSTDFWLEHVRTRIFQHFHSLRDWIRHGDVGKSAHVFLSIESIIYKSFVNRLK
jgi:hypothetical protein